MKKDVNLQKLISFKAYFCDQWSSWLVVTLSWGILLLFLFAFKLSMPIIILISFLWWSTFLINFFREYVRRHRYYQKMVAQLAGLDQAYLLLEMLSKPNFYDGVFLYQLLYQINKSMAENVNKYRTQTQDFQEYCEMWIHEVKTPLATLAVISQDPKVNEQIRRLNDYVEQILYLARAENAEHDYLLGKVSLDRIIGEVANRNREILQAKQTDFVVHDLQYQVHTDAKWCEFIINQIINNSIKYHSTLIEISAAATASGVTLKIRDNGDGISEKDLPRVYEKSFTGTNGRHGNKSTGMGLYIVKTLCDKLGHRIQITSNPGQYTEVTLTFGKYDYYKVAE